MDGIYPTLHFPNYARSHLSLPYQATPRTTPSTLSQAPLYVINPSLPSSQPLSQFHFMKHSSPQSLSSRHKNKQPSQKSQSHVARWEKLPEVREEGGGLLQRTRFSRWCSPHFRDSTYIHEVRWLGDMDPGRIRGVVHGLHTYEH